MYIKMNNINIFIVGVGGQGTLLAGKILGTYAALTGLDCKLNEVHGMAQRGGSVVTHVRMGEKIYAPVISEGEADVIVAFEKLEAFRFRHFLKKDGIIIVNTQEIYPMPVITGTVKYPENIEETLRESYNVIDVDALSVALETGNTKTVNTVILGILARRLNFDFTIFEQAMRLCVKEKHVEENLVALKRGYTIE